MEFMNFLTGVANPVLGAIIMALVCVLFAFAIAFVGKSLTKLNITLTDNQYYDILSLVRTVVVTINQTIVSKIKETSTKLTDDQEKYIYNMALQMIKEMLTSQQVDVLLAKYNLTDIDEALQLVIEMIVAENPSESILIDNTAENTTNEYSEGNILPDRVAAPMLAQRVLSNEVYITDEPTDDESISECVTCNKDCYECDSAVFNEPETDGETTDGK